MRGKTLRRFVFGKNAKRSAWGRIGCSHGMYSGGYNNYCYCIKGLMAYEVLERWGSFHDMQQN